MGDYLTREQRELIEDLVFQTAEMENRFNSWEISPLPYEKCVYDHPEHGLVECTAVSWQLGKGTATVQYHDGQYMKERPGASLQRIVRFAPRWADSDLDAEAARIGCTQFHPPRKQLKYEMRRARQRYGYKLPMTPVGYIRAVKRSSAARAEA